MSDDTLFDFPCDFPIKIMGVNSSEFEAEVIRIVRQHVPDLGEGAVTLQPSRGGRFVSVTITITATSRAQLDAIYADLSDHDQVLMAL